MVCFFYRHRLRVYQYNVYLAKAADLVVLIAPQSAASQYPTGLLDIEHLGIPLNLVDDMSGISRPSKPKRLTHKPHPNRKRDATF